MHALQNKQLSLKYSNWSIDWASESGRLDVLDWWLSSRLELQYTSYAIIQASINGHIQVLDWWLTSGLEIDYDLDIIMSNDSIHIDVINWWKQHELEMKYSTKTMEYETSYCYNDIVDYWKDDIIHKKLINF